MGAEDEAGTGGIADLGHEVGAAGCDFLEPGVDPMVGEPVAGELGECGLAVRLVGCEGRIDGRDADQLLEQRE
jgi:hypothetical protein